jgi:hypothetical protein
MHATRAGSLPEKAPRIASIGENPIAGSEPRLIVGFARPREVTPE